MRSLFFSPRGFALVVLLAPTLILAGCGGSKSATVSGKVTYKGKPVEGGSVIFHSDGPPASMKTGSIEKDGSYTVLGVPVGPAKITVMGLKARRLLLPTQFQQEHGKSAEEAKTQQTEVYVPPKYANTETSDLTYEVTRGSQRKDLELTD